MSVSAYGITAIIGLAALSIAVIVPAAILLSRGDGNAPIQIITSPPESSPNGSSSSLESIQSTTDLQVYISGAVHNPGVYQLSPGDRLVDALEAAGGSTEEADLHSVNLARRVQDEGYYYFPTEGEVPPQAASNITGQSGLTTKENPLGGKLINLNTASASELTSLPGIGEVKAQAIITYREQIRPFNSVGDITSVTGIGSGTYESIKDLVTVGE